MVHAFLLLGPLFGDTLSAGLESDLFPDLWNLIENGLKKSLRKLSESCLDTRKPSFNLVKSFLSIMLPVFGFALPVFGLALPYLGFVLPILKRLPLLIIPGNLLHKRRLVSNQQRHCFFKVIIPGQGFSSSSCHGQKSTTPTRHQPWPHASSTNRKSTSLLAGQLRGILVANSLPGTNHQSRECINEKASFPFLNAIRV